MSIEKIRALFAAGKVAGETTVPEHIETVMSHVYLFPERVYKMFKGDNEWFNQNFNDLSDTQKRFAFSQDDFHLNQMLCPEVYVRLVGAEVADDRIIFTEYGPENSEVVIVMNRLSPKSFLFNKIISGTLLPEDYYACGHSFAERLGKLRSEACVIPEETWHERFEERLGGVRLWVLHNPDIDAKRAAQYCDNLHILSESRKEAVDWKTNDKVVRDIDTHSFNGVYEESTFYLLDSYPPKDEWLFGHELIAPYRFAADIWAFSGNKKDFDAFLDGYEVGLGRELDRTDEHIYVFYASLIMCAYLYNLSGADPEKRVLAEKYDAFLTFYHDEYIAPIAAQLRQVQ